MAYVSSSAFVTLRRRRQLHQSPTRSLSQHILQRQGHHPPLVGTKPHTPSCSRLMSMASGGENVGKTDVPKSVPVSVAHELLQGGHSYLDVRTREEFVAGHVLGAVNVPYMFKVGDGLKKNPDFLDEVSKHFGKDSQIIVGSQRGKISLLAANDLSSAGFSGVTDIAGGYSAWRQSGFPTDFSNCILNVGCCVSKTPKFGGFCMQRWRSWGRGKGCFVRPPQLRYKLPSCRNPMPKSDVAGPDRFPKSVPA